MERGALLNRTSFDKMLLDTNPDLQTSDQVSCQVFTLRGPSRSAPIQADATTASDVGFGLLALDRCTKLHSNRKR